ncbi:hypothetical protein T4D_2247 [Trichinella pseudospiralis]|uniref:Uncharacterized protein n=1 Tax=Trichinella pseudospiralis TaxID=6337 RepID=A0A0V1F3F2_TRIPS|nr:hypothetical protein T4D_2247 [Trichinella pseudospiralis]
MKQEVRWKYHTTSGNSEDKTCLNLCDDVLITFHKITNFIIHLISSVMEDYDAICERKVEICLQKRMMSIRMHMQSEALMGQPMFCIQHHIRSTRSNGIENEHAQWQSWNSPSFFTVKNFNKELNVQNETIESVEASWSPFDPFGFLNCFFIYTRYENICCMPFRHLQMKFMNTSELFEQLRRVVYLSLYYRHTQSCLQSSLNPASYAIGALVYKVMNCNRYNEMNYANFY